MGLEGRISRLEENGARTPMVIQTPKIPIGSNGSEYIAGGRVQNPFKLLLSPLGDLLVLDTCEEDKKCLLRVPHAAKSPPPLESLADSRQAHSWEQINTNELAPQLLLQSPSLGGIALEPNQWLRLYVTMRQNESTVLVRLSLEDEEDEDENGSQPRQSTIVLDYSAHTSEPRAVEVDEKGNIFLVVEDGILFVDGASGKILAKLKIDDSVVDMTLGDDKFLYMATSNALLRVRVKNGPVSFPTDLLLRG